MLQVAMLFRCRSFDLYIYWYFIRLAHCFFFNEVINFNIFFYLLDLRKLIERWVWWMLLVRVIFFLKVPVDQDIRFPLDSFCVGMISTSWVEANVWIVSCSQISVTLNSDSWNYENSLLKINQENWNIYNFHILPWWMWQEHLLRLYTFPRKF